MKKLLIGCMAAIAALIALSGCDQDKVLYNGSSYLMFSDKKRMRYLMFLSLLLSLLTTTARWLSK